MLEIYKNKSGFVRILFMLYLLTLAILTLDGNDLFWMGSIFRKIKYVYLSLAGLYFLLPSNKVVSNRVKILIFILLLHTGLFGFFLVNKNVIDLTHKHAIEMLIYIMMVFFTYYFIKKEDLLEAFIKGNFWILSSCLLLVGLFHKSHFVNPLYFRYVFNSNHGYRTTFGFDHANYTGNMAVFCLIYSVFLLELYRKDGSIQQLLSKRIPKIVLMIDLIIGEILFSTQSRTSILAGFIFVALFIWLHWTDLFHISRKLKYFFVMIFAGLIIIFLLYGGLGFVWESANRSENIAQNYPIFQLFNKWIGMGYIHNSGFLLKAYGLETFALDIYYVYILFTTGYIGSLIILLYFVLVIFFVRTINDHSYRILSICLLSSIMFIGIGQVHILSYTLITGMINWILIYLLIDR